VANFHFATTRLLLRLCDFPDSILKTYLPAAVFPIDDVTVIFSIACFSADFLSGWVDGWMLDAVIFHHG
jgi:hypothetical protein